MHQFGTGRLLAPNNWPIIGRIGRYRLRLIQKTYFAVLFELFI